MDASEGSVAELSRVVAQIRRQWPQVQILIRGDGDFGRKQRMRWCEDHYLLGLPRHPRLQATMATYMEAVRQECAANGAAMRRFKSFRYRTFKRWRCARRVVAKAEWWPGQRGHYARFVVTYLSEVYYGARPVYEDLQYRTRGDMDRRIKEQQLCGSDLHAEDAPQPAVLLYPFADDDIPRAWA